MSFEIQKSILKLLDTFTSANPCGLSALAKRSGFKPAALELLMDEMYASRMVNECTLTKNQITEKVYWKTAVMPKFQYGRNPIAAVIPPPRRNETSSSIAKDIHPMSKSDKPKYTSFVVVKAASEHPNIKFNELVELLIGAEKADFAKARDMVYYCVSAGLLAKDARKQLTLGTNDAWLIKNGFVDTGGKPAVINHVVAGLINGSEIVSEMINSAETPKTAIEPPLISYTPKSIEYTYADTPFCINKLFGLLPSNTAIDISKNPDGEININIAVNNQCYQPKIDEVESCLSAIKTLSQIQVA